MGTKMAEAIARLALACWELGHYPQQFKEAHTIILRKPEKPKYSDLGAWRPIALLSTIGKVIETLIAKRIGKAAEDNHLLPDTQMGARAGRSTETALELLTRQVHTIWSSKRHVATLLSIDISGAFDIVNPFRLLDILRKKRLPHWLVRWVQAFITTRTTTLVIQGHETPSFSVDAGVPQGSPLSPILFLLYIVELHEICNRPWEGVLGIGFVDDTNLLAYLESTKENCKKLERVYRKLL
jgi:retron-type reverse transcriptase